MTISHDAVWDRITSEGRRKANSMIVTSRVLGREELMGLLSVSDTEELSEALADLKSGAGLLSIAEIYKVWDHLSKWLDHNGTPPHLEGLEGRLKEIVVSAWEDASKV
ncbi:hypothetical protein [Aestuariispira insulae]|uniref:Uncharacterized protein n=1 Tax=Aestuariispira insulae TaxID=1461337 RepID=A0A3D9H3T3_9PROT|nr:hypothetical protein [Aestuariispira insulae]RED44145.1 hypothetical protein DFP90_11749 [Aestuariispira insulae]